MDWGDLRVFLVVARAGQLSGASKSLGLDDSTISRRVARLEQALGVLLFERAGRRLRLTEEGKQLLATTEKIESLVMKEVANLEEQQGDLRGRVRIGTSEGFGAHFLAERLVELTSVHPHLEVELVAISRSFSLGLREVDIVVTMDRPVTGDIRFKRLTPYRLAIYASTAYLERHGCPGDISDLPAHRWCGYVEDLLFTDQLELLQFGTLEIAPSYRTTSVTAQLAAVRSGKSLAVLPCFMAKPHADLVQILPGTVDIERTYWIAFHGDNSTSPKVRLVMSAIESWVAEAQELFLP